MRRNVIEKRFPRDRKTGRIFDSIYDAANFYGVSHQTIINYCNEYKKNREFDLNIEWCTIEQLCREIRILKDDIDFYKKSARYQGIEPRKKDIEAVL